MNSKMFIYRLLCLLSAMTPVSPPNLHPPRSLPTYELIYITDGVTIELTGSIIMICRSYATAEKLPLSEVQFWLNGTANSTSLRERTDINVLEVDKYSIRFNLTRNLEGFYTCGKCTDEDCEMSSQKQLISLQTLIPISSGDIPQTQSFTQDQVVLPCPIRPGALLQYYSVIWIKDSVEIAKSLNPQEVMITNDRYSIDGSTFALIIDPVSMPGDLSEDYQCQVFVTNPITRSKQQLQHYPQLTSGVRLSLSLTVQANVGN